MQRLWVALVSKGTLYGLAEIKQKPHQINLVPHIPGGYHLTAHDAVDGRPGGVIHWRLDPKQAEVREWPGGERVSDGRGIVLEWQLPAFAHLKGTLRATSPTSPGLMTGPMMMSVDHLFPQLSELGPRQLKGADMMATDSSASLLGIELLLVEPRNLASLRECLSKIGMLASNSPARAALSSVYIATGYTPWVAVGIFRGSN